VRKFNRGGGISAQGLNIGTVSELLEGELLFPEKDAPLYMKSNEVHRKVGSFGIKKTKTLQGFTEEGNASLAKQASTRAL